MNKLLWESSHAQIQVLEFLGDYKVKILPNVSFIANKLTLRQILKFLESDKTKFNDCSEAWNGQSWLTLEKINDGLSIEIAEGEEDDDYNYETLSSSELESFKQFLVSIL